MSNEKVWTPTAAEIEQARRLCDSPSCVTAVAQLRAERDATRQENERLRGALMDTVDALEVAKRSMLRFCDEGWPASWFPAFGDGNGTRDERAERALVNARAALEKQRADSAKSQPVAEPPSLSGTAEAYRTAILDKFTSGREEMKVQLSLAERTINRIFYAPRSKAGGLARDKEVFDILNEAFDEARAQVAAPEPARSLSAETAQCCMCGKPGLSTAEDGGPEAELTDGRWVCSEICWERATDDAWVNSRASLSAEDVEKVRGLLGNALGDGHSLKAFAGTMLRWDKPGMNWHDEARRVMEHADTWHKRVCEVLAILNRAKP